MEGISRGMTLGGRYTVQQALSSRDGVEQWVATDATLGREVTVTCFPADHPYAEAALDSARRVAGVEDHRLVRVLDVGTDEGYSFVVQEPLHHYRSVAALLREGPLPAEEVRRIVGEAASGLETARHRGLHHLILTPHHVLRAPDGSVQIAGVAIGAALAGRDDDDNTDAARVDVVALVSVAYAGITGQWPGPHVVPGIPSAQRRADDQVPALRDTVPTVPGDLDTLCRTTLNDDDGPTTPGQLARQLSPWPSEQVRVGGRPGSAQFSADNASEGPRRAGTAAAGAAVGASAVAVAVSTRSEQYESVSPFGPRSRAGDDATEPGRLSGSRESLAPFASDDDPTMIGRRPDLDDDLAGESAAERQRRPFNEEYDDLEPPLPLLSTGTAEPDRSSSRMALAIVAATVVVALILGFLGLRGLLSSSTKPAQAGSTASSSTTTSRAPSPSSSSSPATPAGQVIKPASITSYDPNGDNNEHNELAQRAIDGNPKTRWQTHIYATAQFGGIKDGAGLLLDLGSAKQVGSVKVTIEGAPSQMTVYVSDKADRQGAQQLGTIDGAGEQTATAASPLTGRYVIVWITGLSQEGSRAYRDKIPEIVVTS